MLNHQRIIIAVISTNALFRRLSFGELRAMGFSEIIESEDSSALTAVPQLLITDDESTVDTFPDVQTILAVEAPPTNRDAVYLRRPILLSDFQRAVREALKRMDARASEAEKRRRAFRGLARPRRISLASLSLSEDRQAVMVSGNRVGLTPGEALVFCALFEADGEIVTREQLREVLGADGASNLPDVHVCAIRKKLTAAGALALPESLRGKGYRLRR